MLSQKVFEMKPKQVYQRQTLTQFSILDTFFRRIGSHRKRQSRKNFSERILNGVKRMFLLRSRFFSLHAADEMFSSQINYEAKSRYLV